MSFEQTIWVSIISGSIGIIGVIIGAGIGIFSSYLSFKREEKRNKKKLFLSKLEEIFKLSNTLREFCIEEIFVIVNRIDEKKLFSLVYGNYINEIDLNATMKETNKICSDLNLLIEFYAPEIKEDFKEFMENRNQCVSLIVKSSLNKPKGEEIFKVKKTFKDFIDHFNKLNLYIRDKVTSLSKNYI